MGTLTYGSPEIEIDLDDRTLAHLQMVIVAKLRRRESFLFSWAEPADAGSGRSCIWLNPSILLYFRFNGSRIPAINRTWIEQLVASANSGAGLVLTEEPVSD